MKRIRVESINGSIRVELADNFSLELFDKVWNDIINKVDVNQGVLSSVNLAVENGRIQISTTYKRSIPLPVKETQDVKVGKGDLVFGVRRQNLEVINTCITVNLFEQTVNQAI